MFHIPTFAFKQHLPVRNNFIAIYCDQGLSLPKELTQKYDQLQNVVKRAAKADDFKGKLKTRLDILAPGDIDLDRLLIFGIGEQKSNTAQDWMALGGYLAGCISQPSFSVILGALSPENICAFLQGFYLRSYRFDKYKICKQDNDKPALKTAPKITIVVDAAMAAKKLWQKEQAVVQGVCFARDLVNEPANVLTTQEFAKRLQALKTHDVAIEIMDEAPLRKIGMKALLAVGQGSNMPSKVVIMQWLGGKSGEPPFVAVGKGVVFDTGGISIKPAAGMEGMKGDMAGAAAVAGLMQTLAARKAKANVVGIVGLVENMPDGKAQRPGDVITSLSGQTIEVINTDAEGRLVLADLLWYVEDRFRPKFMVNLATLTGAILVALGDQYAGLFSNSDQLAQALLTAGNETDEQVWRMPLAAAYDKKINSKIADMKNTGGRWAGSITAAQFLQRFVRETQWAHIDIAGTAMDAAKTDINQSWGSGFGVRLLDRLVTNMYET